jgi:hypothetical protein
MEFVTDTRQSNLLFLIRDMEWDRNDATYVIFSLIGMALFVHVVELT